MKYKIYDIDKGEFSPKEKVIALGNFDGVHLGHQALIKRDLELAERFGYEPSILLFKQNSKIRTMDQKRYLTSLEDKIKIMSSLGIRCFYTVDFSPKFMALSPEEFIGDFLVDKLKAKALVIGQNYSFGYKASGTPETLKKFEEKYSYKTYICDYVKYGDRIINSTDIRNMIREGKVDLACKELGRPFMIRGKVVDGAHRGRKLNFPTANVQPDFSYCLPKNGVYLVRVILDGEKYYSITDVGRNPTFENEDLKIEAHILDFSGNIYGKTIELEFLEYFRGDFHFNGPDELIAQMEKDKERAYSIINRL